MARSDRPSTNLNGNQVDNFLAAADHADRISQPLNAHLTVHWENAGHDGVQNRQGRMLECARHWLTRRGHQLTAAWVIERGMYSGLHTHTMLHIPRTLLKPFAAKLPDWIGVPALDRENWPKDGTKSHTIACGEAPGDSPLWQLDRVYDGLTLRRYLLKAAPDQYSRHSISHQDQGIVIGKRIGVSNNIAYKARQDAAQRDLAPGGNNTDSHAP